MIRLLSEIEILELVDSCKHVCKKELRRNVRKSFPIAIRSCTYTNTCNAYLLMPMNTELLYIVAYILLNFCLVTRYFISERSFTFMPEVFPVKKCARDFSPNSERFRHEMCAVSV